MLQTHCRETAGSDENRYPGIASVAKEENYNLLFLFIIYEQWRASRGIAQVWHSSCEINYATL